MFILKKIGEKQQQKLLCYCQIFYQVLSIETKWRNKIDLCELCHFKLRIWWKEGWSFQLLFQKNVQCLGYFEAFSD